MSVHLRTIAEQIAPSCACGDAARVLALVLPILAEAESSAYTRGLADGAAVADSVARMMPENYHGPESAHAASVARFHEWHRTARAELEEVAA